MNFNFYLPVRIIGGENCVREHAALLGPLGRRALVITGASSAKKSGALDDVSAALSGQDIAFEVFDGVTENPLLSTCVQAGQAARKCGADFIVAIGGGSVLDAARAASVFALRDFAQPADLFITPITESLPLVTVGTTAGTGSEVDHLAVITDDSADGYKKSIKGDCLFARIAFCDYRYTKSMNLRQTVSTGLDALCHCLESWLNNTVTEPVAGMAARGAALIYPRLREIAAGVFDPSDDAVRRDLYYGSLWGGLCITHCGTGFPHPAGYPLTEHHGTPHGVACALFEPAFLQTALPHVSSETRAEFERQIGKAEEVCDTLCALTRNSFTLSETECAAVGARVQTAANTPKTPGGYDGARAEALARELFLAPMQSEPVAGEWIFGL